MVWYLLILETRIHNKRIFVKYQNWLLQSQPSTTLYADKGDGYGVNMEQVKVNMAEMVMGLQVEATMAVKLVEERKVEAGLRVMVEREARAKAKVTPNMEL